MNKAKTMNAFNLLYYKPKLWERVVLWFCPLHTHEATDCVIWYKKFWNRMYIYGYIRARLGEALSPDETHTTDTNYDNAGNN